MTHSDDKSKERKEISEQNKLAQQKLKTRFKNEELNPCFKVCIINNIDLFIK